MTIILDLSNSSSVHKRTNTVDHYKNISLQTSNSASVICNTSKFYKQRISVTQHTSKINFFFQFFRLPYPLMIFSISQFWILQFSMLTLTAHLFLFPFFHFFQFLHQSCLLSKHLVTRCDGKCVVSFSGFHGTLGSPELVFHSLNIDL